VELGYQGRWSVHLRRFHVGLDHTDRVANPKTDAAAQCQAQASVGRPLVIDDSPLMSAISRQTGDRNDETMWDRRGIQWSKVDGAEGQKETTVQIVIG